jgi:hypothetical protein
MCLFQHIHQLAQQPPRTERLSQRLSGHGHASRNRQATQSSLTQRADIERHRLQPLDNPVCASIELHGLLVVEFVIRQLLFPARGCGCLSPWM